MTGATARGTCKILPPYKSIKLKKPYEVAVELKSLHKDGRRALTFSEQHSAELLNGDYDHWSEVRNQITI